MSMPSFTKVYHHKPYPSISPTRPELSAEGKIVLVAGAGSGVGEATAYSFSAANAKVIVLCGRRLDPLNEVKATIESKYPSTKAVAYSMDVAKEDSVANIFEQVKNTYGPIDIVVNSAAYLSDQGTIEKSSLQNFWEAFEVTCKGGFLVAQHFLRNRSTNDPILISFNSLLAHMQASAVSTAPASYMSSKMGLGKMIEYVAQENEGVVRAYNVHPGVIVTSMSTKSVEMAPDPEAVRKGHIWDDVNLPGHFCVWLASKEGHAIPSGRFLWSHWDVDELKQRSKELYDDPTTLTLTLREWPFPQPERVNK